MKLIVTLILFTISNAYYFFNSLNRIYIKAEDGLDIAISSKYAENNKNEYSLLFIHGSNAGGWVFEEYWMEYFSKNGYNSYAINMRGSNVTGTLNNKQFVTISEHVEDLKNVIDYFEKKRSLLL